MSLTARNTAIPVRLVGASALLSALALVVYLEHWARDQASIPWHQQNYQRVLDAYQQVRYVPPRDGYAEQIARVCSYTLAWGQHCPGSISRCYAAAGEGDRGRDHRARVRRRHAWIVYTPTACAGPAGEHGELEQPPLVFR
jgi:hypothetical protein